METNENILKYKKFIIHYNFENEKFNKILEKIYKQNRFKRILLS